MMRWRKIEIRYGEEAPPYAIHTNGNGYLVLQQLVKVLVPQWHEESASEKTVETLEWQDVQILWVGK